MGTQEENPGVSVRFDKEASSCRAGAGPSLEDGCKGRLHLSQRRDRTSGVRARAWLSSAASIQLRAVLSRAERKPQGEKGSEVPQPHRPGCANMEIVLGGHQRTENTVTPYEFLGQTERPGHLLASSCGSRKASRHKYTPRTQLLQKQLYS